MPGPCKTLAFLSELVRSHIFHPLPRPPTTFGRNRNSKDAIQVWLCGHQMSICPCSRIFTKELILPIWTAAGEHKSGLKALLLATPRCWQSAITMSPAPAFSDYYSPAPKRAKCNARACVYDVAKGGETNKPL